MKQKNNILPFVCITAGAALWGFIGIFLNVLSGFSSADLLVIRSLITAALLFTFIAVKDYRLLKIHLRDIWYFIGTGIISFASYSFAYFAAIRLTSMAAAAILLYTSPIFVTVMSVLIFREKLTLKKAAAVILAFSGCILITGLGTETQLNAKGLCAGLISGFCYALYSIFGKIALKKYSTLTVTAYTFLFASAAVLPLADFGSIRANLDMHNTLILILFALLTGLVPYALYTYGLSRTPAGKAAIIACIEPVTASLAGCFILGEEMSLKTISGIILVLSAVIVLQIKEKASSKKNQCKGVVS